MGRDRRTPRIISAEIVKLGRKTLGLSAAVRGLLGEIDSSLPVSDVQTMEQNVATSMAQPRFMTLLLSLFAGVALMLAAIGTYGVMSYSVAERNREIGIRMALGADRGDVLWLVLREGIVLTLTGLGVGLLLSVGTARLLASLLYEVSTLDPVVFILAPLVLAVSTLLASYLPARRATRVVPMVALRHE